MDKQPIGPYERLISGSLLVMAAGVLDSYTYMQDGGVFAGLQTGNLILTGLRIGRGDYDSIVQALVSLLMFAVGVAIIRVIQYHYPSERAVTRKRVTLAFEILIFVVVSLIAGQVSILITTGLLALAAASQLQEFRRMKNSPFTPLMMTGNVRTLSESVLDFVAQGDLKALKNYHNHRLLLRWSVVKRLFNPIFSWSNHSARGSDFAGDHFVCQIGYSDLSFEYKTIS
ncbi:YoaK family protein [Lentilactobacillus parakefiri]|uniref:YoaK family protein n=1 Tax=Lentilactobacillus parakefiri TaxID=152332 RepID=UPI001CDAE2FA|nr:YoaK family protein [Lentilactobacillus parakefiri]